MRTTVALDEALVSRAQLLSGFQERSALLRGGSEAKLEAIPRRRAGRFHNTYFEAKMARADSSAFGPRAHCDFGNGQQILACCAVHCLRRPALEHCLKKYLPSPRSDFSADIARRNHEHGRS